MNFVTPTFLSKGGAMRFGGDGFLSKQSEVSLENKNPTWWEYLLMFFLLSISGNPYISIQKFELFIILSVVIPIVHIVRNFEKTISFRTVGIFVFLLGYEIMHAFMFNLNYSLTIFKLFLVLLLSAATMDIFKDRFIFVLTKTMVIISFISFVFTFLCYVPGLNRSLYHLAENLFHLDKNWDGYSTPTLLIYTFHPEFFEGKFSYSRNAAIFWESGAFSVFLNITLFLYYSSKTIKSVKDLFDKDARILVIALMSTTSTMGAISLMIILVFFSFQLKSNFKYIMLVLILVAGFFAFTTVEFLGEKINRELGQSQVTNNRFGSALKDFENIVERPILGWSRRIEVIFNTSESNKLTHRPNGFTNFLRCYGLVYFTFYFILIYQAFRNVYVFYHHSFNYAVPLFGVILLWIISFSELIFDLVFLKALIFLYFAYYPFQSPQAQTGVKKKFIY
jgi:hypothetical protein